MKIITINQYFCKLLPEFNELFDTKLTTKKSKNKPIYRSSLGTNE